MKLGTDDCDEHYDGWHRDLVQILHRSPNESTILITHIRRFNKWVTHIIKICRC